MLYGVCAHTYIHHKMTLTQIHFIPGAAERLEAKAAAFEDKKRALMELNEAIEHRRQQLIKEAIKIKKRFEPDRYRELVGGEERLLQAEGSVK
ncbi:hypothetical protein EON65_45700 [archaeon]|nr:MAG: hypothetical protein EON65_45700 [archaeon]